MVWLVKTLGPVLMGAKPCELLSFKINTEKEQEKIKKIGKALSSCKRISYKSFIYKKATIKILFFHPQKLDEILTKKYNTKFLNSLGYPKDYNMNIYLDHLINKIKNETLPHEIGVFLGYPLKDILGFMGYTSLTLTKINGWRVYGNPKISDERFEEFVKAKQKIRELLLWHDPEKILLAI